MNGSTWNGIHVTSTFHDYTLCNMAHEMSQAIPSGAVNCRPCPVCKWKMENVKCK